MNKKKSIVVLSLVAVFIILMTVFAVVDFPIGNTLYDYTGYVKTIKLGLDLKGGVLAVYEVVEDGQGNMDSRINGTVESLQSLLVSKGYTEAVVSNSDNTIRVEVPDVDDPNRVFKLIGKPASLEFRSSQDDSAVVLIEGNKHIENAFVTMEDGKYAIGLKFNAVGTKKFSDVTTEYNGKTVYVYVNDEYYQSVNINTPIADGNAIITGDFTFDEANDFATKIQSGSFGVTLKITETRAISATLGKDAIKKSLIAGAIGLAIIFLFMALTYRMMGVMADIALAMYVLILLWFCAVLPWVQLSLPGIAGLILGIGMAVDANVVIFERIKDEYKHSNKPIASTVKIGFKRSLGAILDGNITTLIGAVVLWIVGTASISGFAVVLFFSILISMFSALVLTRLLLYAILPFNNTNPKLYNLKRAQEVSGNED